jgi:hypothetical protein
MLFCGSPPRRTAMIVAGSHSHKGKNFTLLGVIFLARSKILSKKSSHFANMPNQSLHRPLNIFVRNFIGNNFLTSFGTVFVCNLSFKINNDNGLLILTTINCGFSRNNHLSRNGSWEMHPSSPMWHVGCKYLVAHGKFVPNKN